MSLKVKLHTSDCKMKCNFHSVQEVSDGGFERGYEAGYNVGFADGAATAEIDSARFATAMSFSDWSLFGGEVAEVTIYNQKSWNGMFAVPNTTPNTTLRHLTVNSNIKPTSMSSTFKPASDADTVLTRLTLNFDTSQCTDFYSCFRGLRNLEVIDGIPLDFSSANKLDNYIFYVCSHLKEVRVKPSTISKDFLINTSQNLSEESVWSIINGLADLTGGTSQKISFNIQVKQKFGAAEKDAISAKNWVLG